METNGIYSWSIFLRLLSMCIIMINQGRRKMFFARGAVVVLLQLPHK